ncbi:hypothetical protein AGMMS49992_24850 [Clostridia bacterium]|nr:hypothetical protein AGMMS49992_24850 [Clostridia bacterium]
MVPLLITLIAVGLVPVHLRLALQVTPEGCVNVRVSWGAIHKDFSIGAEKLGVSWLVGMISKIKDPRPLLKLPPLVRLNLNVRSVSMRCKVGTSDAAATAILSGALRMAFQVLCGWVATWSARTGEPDKPEIDVRVTPVFNHPIFDMDAGFEVHARLGKFANLGIRFAAQQISSSINKQKTTHAKPRVRTA